MHEIGKKARGIDQDQAIELFEFAGDLAQKSLPSRTCLLIQ